MFEKFTYTNHVGEVITFGENGVYANYNNLRDYKWSYSKNGCRISKIYRECVEKTLPVVFIGNTGETCRTSRNAFYEVVERDAITWKDGTGKYGKLSVGDYYMNCIMIGTENSDYLRSERLLKTTYTILTDDPVWRREQEFTFQKYVSPATDEDDNSKSYPYDYPYDYSASLYAAKQVENYFSLGCTHIMTIEGPCSNPTLTIGGHTYAMNCTLYDHESIEIDSAKKTIIKISSNSGRVEENYFGYRYKAESILKEIPYGVSNLVWDGTFTFGLKLIETRSEPNWTYTKISEDITDIIEAWDGTYYLLDSENRVIQDSEGRAIKVTV